MRIDPATPEDAVPLSHVAETSFKDTFAHLYPPEDLASFLGEWMPPEKVARQITDPAMAIRVARDDAGALVGYIKLGPVDFDLPPTESAQGALEIHQLYMLAAAKGTGLADQLMRWALAEARARGAARLYLSVYIDNHRAQRFYARYGFYEVGKLAFRVGNTIDDDRIWRCDL